MRSITNEVLKFENIIEFQTLRIAICLVLLIYLFSYMYFELTMERVDLILKKLAKMFAINQNSNQWVDLPIAYSSRLLKCMYADEL